ncbi:hypothetical protein [Achromobacter xylosoxidans]|uniref:Uncharacterized protein n=1 Tax=Alcaligenes xylosoxydans xylosoxydans TaxID=85698 RepID=A0A424W8Z2_ALCXX|nr:hypothetical protein [Achromobacter xylosoxidans]MBC9906431.1 hypothetical protein [Achromobacter xylosoxidans]MBD0871242.1 hypothetical protein [Achromobacter xylosoxidans]QNP83573.1 hypothetical protein IAG39_18615 [Achromobacter xylosoxidans]RPJ89671.1 hypothetical protein DY367_21440 [Achromobacter xylosoxidans]
MEHPTRLLQRAWLLLLAILITLHGGLAHAQAFDRQAENARYRQWLEDFRADLQRLRQSPDPAKADIDSLFAKTIVPASRGTQLVRTLVEAPGDSTSGEVHYAGLQRVFLAALANAVVAGDGGNYPETQAKYQKQVLRVRYMHVDGGGRLESFFNDPENFKPYRLPAPGTLERDAYPFLLFEEHEGKLRLGGVSKEFWDLVKFMDTQQYA